MSGLVSGITGAAPIWHALMAHLVEGKTSEPFQKPQNIIQMGICSISGLLPQADPATRCQTRFEYFIKGTQPKMSDPGNQKVFVDKTTNELAKPGQTDNVEQKDELIVKDATGESYCVTCAHTDQLTPTPTPKP
jgi:membrane carboxypeptidase/penicillin-binding protein